MGVVDKIKHPNANSVSK